MAKVPETIFLGLICLLLSSCSLLRPGGLSAPSAVQSEYFTTDMAGFKVNRDDLSRLVFRYFIDLTINKPVPKSALLELSFENPQDKTRPLGMTKILSGDEKTLSFRSEPVSGLRAYQGYAIDIFLYENSTKANLLGKHRQVVQSIVNQR